MFVKLIKAFSILVVSIALVGLYIQISDFSISEPTKTSTKNSRQSDGAFIEYYQNGKISSEEFYKDGLRYGNWRFYYEDGALKQELNYQKGLLEGEQRYFSTQGKIIYNEVYKKGKIIEHTIQNDSLFIYEVNLLSNGENLFKEKCIHCHLSKKGKVVRPYYLQKITADSLTIDSVFLNYLNTIHGDSLHIPKIDSLDSYDVHAVIHYIDKQYQTAKRRPKHAVRLRKVRLNKETPQL